MIDLFIVLSCLEFHICLFLFFLVTGGVLLPLIDPGVFLIYICFYCGLRIYAKPSYSEDPITLCFFLLFVFFLKKFLFIIPLMIGSIFLESLLTIIFLLIPVAVYSLLERKIIALVQRRKGPNLIGLWGLLQFLIDGLKLFLKEVITPTRANSG
jgi:formate hydrogenlyase subunit 4